MSTAWNASQSLLAKGRNGSKADTTRPAAGMGGKLTFALAAWIASLAGEVWGEGSL